MPDSHNSNLLTYSKHYSTNYTTHLAKSRNNYTFVAANAFVVQWIEQKFPKLQIRVRFPAEVQNRIQLSFLESYI